ncbi:MAG: DUF928 domain-containing protein [Deltaproteobacteria bacterium]
MKLRKGWIFTVFLAAAACVSISSSSVCGQAASADKEKAPAPQRTGEDQKKGSAAGSVPVYKPPLRGSPGGRVGGGTRGASLEAPVSLSVLVPDHVGLTLQSQPNLYWFISRKPAQPVEFTLMEKDAGKPLVEARLKPLEKAGIQRIPLANYGVQLRRNVLYKWFVALITDPDRRSRDILSGGMIEVVSPSPDLSAKLSQVAKAKQPFLLAEQGLWYDALSGVSEKIDAAPRDLSVRKQRAALLEQVGLKEAAEFDLKEARSLQ